MKLERILKNCQSIFTLENFNNINLKGVSTNSTEVKDNFLFGAIKGKEFNGENFIKDLILFKNLVIVLSSKSNSKIYKKNKNITIIKTTDVRKLIAEISYFFYKKSFNELVAITGTNGKTSIAEYTRQIWNLKKKSCCSIGTLGIIYKKKKILETNLTTPEPDDINRNLSLLSKKGCKKAVIEASSIGLDQKRLFPFKFNKVVFTNLTIDHLDYHKSFKAYKISKGLLFKNHTNEDSLGIINADSRYSKFFLDICKKKKIKIIDFGKNAKFLKIKKINQSDKIFNVFISIKKKKFSIFFESFSIYEIYNKICALLIVFGENLEKKDFEILKQLKNPPGRIEKVSNKKKLNIFIDYAHTPDALKNVLSALKSCCKGKLITIIGCGGERDKSKRPLMTKEALKFSNKIIITDDNPRNEDPRKIRKEMISKIPKKNLINVKEIASRKNAIQYCINILEKDDFLLIAGKGHENYQIIKNNKFFFSDKKTVIEFLSK
ncbi:MAG: UDP-N-acetylmuramoyl-L-alanyl-D-glutamate--2,6-diaminopimelate ligase [Rickettsiales bacterium]|nr:UDP-N-acetylmuramoyl-L-alanyl-D-glutamate--2,6-diaminopimelate ligase [Rickettsiales bacterium]|tara:strand:+ start:1254 stop:2729 length:1476 start_codon:yes stop_codon:yes gene_type:complete